MSGIAKLPFKYIVEATKNNPDASMTIETPWLEEDQHYRDQIEYEEIYKDDVLEITEQLHPNGFHLRMIHFINKKIIAQSNWELDYVPQTDEYLPRVQ